MKKEEKGEKGNGETGERVKAQRQFTRLQIIRCLLFPLPLFPYSPILWEGFLCQTK